MIASTAYSALVFHAPKNETSHWFGQEFSGTGERLIGWANMRSHSVMNDTLDSLVIGGGPAGLTAAIYLARFHLRVLVVDRGGGRAQSISKTHNHAGFPDGIVGAELVANMARQARSFGARIECGTVTALRREADGFVVTIGGAEQRAKAVLLATGVRNIAPPGMNQALHDQAVADNLLRYCPVCDGYEVTDADVGVIGTGAHAAREALFLRSFTARVTLIAPCADHELSAADHAMLKDAGIALIDGPIIGYAIKEHRLLLAAASARPAFEAVYPALGTIVHSDLAVSLGAAVTASGSIEVDAHQRTTIAGLYAAGDVVLGLDQISHAMGDAGVAATAIRNDLNARCVLRR